MTEKLRLANTLPEDVRENLSAAIRSHSLHDILDFIADDVLRGLDEIGFEPDEQIARDDAAIIAHAASHVKG